MKKSLVISRSCKYVVLAVAMLGFVSFSHAQTSEDETAHPVSLVKTASKSAVKLGDVVTFTLEVTNTSHPGGFIVRDILPTEMRLIRSSVVVTSDNANISDKVFVTDNAQILDFQEDDGVAFGLTIGKTLNIRYQAVIGLKAKAGTILTNRAQVRSPGGVLLSKMSKVDARVVGDSLFDKSWVAGRVYCDDDGNGWADELDSGVYGAHVYIDTGRYAVTDAQGRYHLTNIPPGLHLLKVDTNTLPPRSTMSTPESRVLHFSPGMPHQLSFGVRCNLEPARPNRMERVESKNTPPAPKSVVVSGSLKDMSISVDGVAMAAPASVSLEVPGLAKNQTIPDLRWGPNGLLQSLRLEASGPSNARMWRLWVEVKDQKDRWLPLYEKHGQGTVPSTLLWDGKDSSGAQVIAARNRVHRARLVVVDVAGGRWTAAPVHFTVDWRQMSPEKSGEVSGQPFGRRNRANYKLLKLLKKVARTLKKNPGTQALVVLRPQSQSAKYKKEAHVRGRLAVEWLVKAARVMPNRVGHIVSEGPASVSILSYDPTKLRKDPQVPKVAKIEPSVKVGDTNFQIQKTEQFAGAIRKPLDGVLVVELKNKHGVTRELLVRMAGSVAVAIDVPVQAALEQKVLKVNESLVDLALLDLRVRASTEEAVIVGSKLQEALSFDVNCPTPAIKSWAFSVLDGAGKTVFGSNGEGSPPKTLAWSNTKKISAGDYTYGFDVLSLGGVSAESPRRVLTVVKKKKAKRKAKKTAKKTVAADAAKTGVEEASKSHEDGPPQREWALVVGKSNVDLKSPGVADSSVRAREGSSLKLVVTGRHGQKLVSQVQLPAPQRVTELEVSNAPGLPVLSEAIKRRKEGREPVTPLVVAGLTAELPPEGSELGQPLLPIRGTVPDEAKISVAVNGKAVKVVHGQFELMLPLKAGKNTVTISARDKEGNIARIVRNYSVKGSSLFLMVLADGALTQKRTGLTGLSDNSTIKVGKLKMHGRGVLYLKARIKGNDLIKKIGITAYADSTREREFSNFVDQVIDPEQNYPVYGDASTEHADVKSRGKFYVAVDLDETKMIFGTFKPDDWGMSLLRYERVQQGGYIRLKKAFKPGYETVIEGFASYDNVKVSSGFAVLRGTGGSYYFLPDKDIIQGSENITIAIHDRDGGGELQRIQQVRNVDYEIDYQGGRVVFKKPIPSRVNSSFLIGAADTLSYGADKMSGLLTLGGHEVRVLVDYQTRALKEMEETNYGLRASQQVTKMVTVRGGYIQEGKASGQGADYKIYGAGVKVTPSKTTVIDAEWAESESSNGVNSISVDGGLSFQKIGTPQAESDSGMGISVRAETDLGEFMGKDQPFLKLSASYRNQERGFVSNGTIMEQGSEHGGGSVLWHIARGKRLVLRHDTLKTKGVSLSVSSSGISRSSGCSDSSFLNSTSCKGAGHVWIDPDSVATLIDEANDNDNVLRNRSRMLTSAQYTHRMGKWTYVGEVLHGLETDELHDDVNRGALATLAKYRVNNRLSIYLEQQFMIGGDERVIRSTMDGLVTGFGMEINVGADLALTIGEKVRWSGEDATSIGMRTKLSKNSSMYVQQRLVHPADSHRWVPATVMGSEERWADGSGRSYGEYQMGSTASGTFNRAVLGVGRRFEVMNGFYADIAVERSHSTVVDYVGTERDTNTVSLGGEYLASTRFKFTTRFETRYQEGDGERLQLVGLNRLSIEASEKVSLFIRTDLGMTQDLVEDKREAETMNISFGLAFRPLDEGLNILFKLARIVDMRPVGVETNSPTTRSTADVVGLETIIELPLRFQFTPKVAYRHAVEEVEGSDKQRSHSIMAATRFAFHLWKMLDIAGEYRFLFNNVAEQMQHGALAEIAVTIRRYTRIGAGYNFSYFDDDMFSPLSRNDHGFFVRLTGMY